MKLTRTTPIDTLTTGVAQTKQSFGTDASTASCTCSHVSSLSSSSLRRLDEETTKSDSYYRMEPEVAEALVFRTEQRVQAFLDRSPWVRDHQTILEQLPRLAHSDFVVGKLIAQGGFSNIHDIVSFRSDCELSPSQQYVVKHLKPSLALNEHRLRSAARDICNEIHVLASLDHPHIVKVAGLSQAGISGFAKTCRADSFFLVLEKLEQSLLRKISNWRVQAVRKDALSLSRLGQCPETTSLFLERILAVQQLVSALVYLHGKRILHRDVKPANVGYDKSGCLKLIDFGLATELPSSFDSDETFKLGVAGTTRYQAPEVIQKKPYSFKAETYSVSILLWEIMALTRPFEKLTGEEVKQSVSQVNYRPAIPGSWPSALKRLLRKSWAKRSKTRPTMAEMEVALASIADCDYSKKSYWFQF